MTDATRSDEFYESFWWLHKHPVMQHFSLPGSAFPENLCIYAAKINPDSRQVEEDIALNTEVEIWLEVSLYQEPTEDEKNLWGLEETLIHDYSIVTGKPDLF